MSVNRIVEAANRPGSATGTKLTHVNSGLSVASVCRELLAGLASLKLTVFLMVLAVIVILIFTLQLTQMDIWQAKSMHFPELLVFIRFQKIIPPMWLPDWQNIPGGLFIPSGFSILLAMLVNLTAAHLTRFRIAGSRREVIGGLALVLLGTGLAFAVIWNGQNPYGFQAKPPIPWTTLWNLLQAGFAICAAGCLWLGIRMGAQRTIERIILIAGGVFLGAVFAFLAARGSKAFIGDSAMRILWQMIQCLAPSLVILLGARQIFGRKAGMVLIHVGVAILMLNEIYTALFAIEQRIQFFEGEKVNYAVDFRHSELAIVDYSNSPNEEHVAVPASLLVAGQTLKHPDLPVDLICVEYFQNATVEPLAASDREAVGTQGVGRMAAIRELSPVSGTGDQVDQPAAYVKVLDKQNHREIGTFLLAQTINGMDETRRDDSAFPANIFSIGDKKYHIALRFKRYYKPYTLTLLDTAKETYLGTQTPRSFSSEFRLVDSETGVDMPQRVWMNNPLRYRNETFYQANYDDSTGREASALQVVRNSGWMIPYFCCVFVGLGLVVQFGQTLIGYIKRLNQDLVKPRIEVMRSNPLVWVVFAVPVIIFAAGIFSGLRKPDEHNGFRMDLLGRIPVVHLGRAKPLDSVARSIVRRSSGVESVNKGDEESTRIDAVAWLADSMFGGKDFADYRLFKIDDPNLRGSLSLVESRKRYRYSINEVEKAEVELQKLFDNAEAKPEEQRSAFDHRTAELWQLLAESRALSGLLNVDWDGKKVLELYYEIVLPDMTRRQAMLIAPLPNEKEAWGQLSVALFCQQVLDRAQRFGVTTCTELAKRVVAEEKDTVREQEIRAGVFQQLTSDDAIRQQAGDMSAQQWRLFVFKQIRQAPLTELEKMAGPIVAAVDKNIEASLADQARAIAENLRKWFGNEELAAVSMPYDVRRLFDLKTAYQANDKTKFNGALESYLASIEKSPPQGIVGWRQTLEGFFNRFSPYYLATICYLGGFLFTVLAWIVAPLWLNRVATAVLFGGWLLHLTGIIMSIGISGRAPVTGLYSSFVFVTCVVVGVFMAVERFTRMGLGNLLGSVLGVGGLLWAWNIALGTEDVFAVLVAVLDTNFWLSTHVICVSLGYSATLAAGALGVTYVLGGLLTQSLTASRRLQLTRLIYGTVCFGLLFSFVGTVLGGLWADDSWGRFWGWDPKENGALIIVLWNAVVLHARWGGLVRDRGMAGLAVIGNAVTAWSWEGVNQLGVGLHAYALSDANKFRMLLAFWVAQLVIAGLALIPPQYWLSKPDAKKTAPVLDDVRRGRNRS